jgi:2-polyprenyl-6-methoxyphenol hydroxylase-like FAD-dependent oxidoreductase
MHVHADAGARRAVVVGASMAGLVAARVLADHFDDVVIVERDRLPAGAEVRKGVPQGRHLHGLLRRGEAVLEQLFPGISEALLVGGAQRVDFSADIGWYHFGAWKSRFASGVTMLAMTRPYLEVEVRRRVLALPNVSLLDDHDALGPRVVDGRIAGLQLRPRAGGDVLELPSDLVVDCGGRGSSTPRWLAALGLPEPEEEAVVVHVGYATRLFRRVTPSQFPWKALYVIGTPPACLRVGALFPIEGDRWIGLVAGLMRDYPTADLPGFLEFARGLPVDDMHRALASLEPLDDGATHRLPSNLRRRYERLARFPDGLVVLGDALCSFNPIYGQGMTSAGLSALALGECLAEQRAARGRDLTGLPARFFRRVAKVIDVPWMMSTLEDFRIDGVEGSRPPAYPLIAGFLAHVHRAACRDRDLARHFLRAMHMLESPAVFLRPDLFARAMLRGGLPAAGPQPVPAAPA